MTSSATHQHRRLSRIVVTTGAAVLAIGLLTTGSAARTMRVRSLRPLSVLSAALWKLLQRLRLCHRQSLTPIVNSFLGPVTGALNTMPNDPFGKGLVRHGL